MKYVNLGRSGLKVSRLCLGCMSYGEPERLPQPWSLDEKASRPLIRQALEAGINFFDTANIYSGGSSEEITGKALREMARRDEIVVATKTFFPWRNSPNTGFLSRKAIFQSIDDSLMRLGMDYVDLFQIHRFDYSTPVEETMEALHDVVKAGKARYIGASSMEAWRFAKMQHTAERNGWTRFITMQPQYNLLYREEEREMLPLCEDQGVGVIPWSPMARGRLTRDWSVTSRRTQNDAFALKMYETAALLDKPVIDVVASIAEKHAVPRAHVAIAWLLSKSVITAPIIGATKPEHLSTAISALDFRWVIAASPDYLERYGTPEHPDDLLHHRCISNRLGDDRVYRWELARDGETYQMTVPGSVTVNHAETGLVAVLGGAGLMYFPEPLVAPYVKDGRLRLVLTEWSPLEEGFHIYYSSRRQLPTGLRLLIEFIQEARPLGL
ncbi:aldo/keto reductase [Klebsiella pneumoniae]|nr:aldo/keto reductase [Klebsiella pneumoniae]